MKGQAKGSRSQLNGRKTSGGGTEERCELKAQVRQGVGNGLGKGTANC